MRTDVIFVIADVVHTCSKRPVLVDLIGGSHVSNQIATDAAEHIVVPVAIV